MKKTFRATTLRDENERRSADVNHYPNPNPNADPNSNSKANSTQTDIFNFYIRRPTSDHVVLLRRTVSLEFNDIPSCRAKVNTV